MTAKFYRILLLIGLLINIAIAQNNVPICPIEEEPELSLTEKIDESFGVVTKPFVDFIFYSFTIQKVEQTFVVDLSSSDSNKQYVLCKQGDEIRVSEVKVQGKSELLSASKIKIIDKNDNVRVEDKQIFIQSGNAPENIEIKAIHSIVAIPWVLLET